MNQSIPNTILVADDDQKIRKTLSGILTEEGYRVILAGNGKEALEKITANAIDLLLLDLKMPGIDGLQVLERLAQQTDKPQVIVISAHGTIQKAVKAVQLGAFDFLEKPVDLDRLLITVNNALKQKSLLTENITLKKRLREEIRMIGKSRAMQPVYDFIKMAAGSDARILITGENGAGKDLLAKSIHAHSDRASRPFVMINCAAIPAHLFESELFGYEKGAFTGAVQSQSGKFELAEGGTLFLNEITEISPEMQSKLLHAIEHNRFHRLGGSREKQVDVRIIAATNRDVHEAVESGQLRQDLFYRLNVLTVKLPPLRERGDDVLLLVEYFIKDFSQRKGMFAKTLTDKAKAILKQYPWPGNIRELQNLIQRLMLLASAETIDSDEIKAHLSPAGDDTGFDNPSAADIELKAARRQWEKQFILNALKQNDWVITKTADALKVERTYLHRLIKQLGIETPGA